jgi:hypothetical protein
MQKMSQGAVGPATIQRNELGNFLSAGSKGLVVVVVDESFSTGSVWYIG